MTNFRVSVFFLNFNRFELSGARDCVIIIINSGMLCTYPKMGRSDYKDLEVEGREEDFGK